MRLTLRLTDANNNEIDAWTIIADVQHVREAYEKVSKIADELRILVEDAIEGRSTYGEEE